MYVGSTYFVCLYAEYVCMNGCTQVLHAYIWYVCMYIHVYVYTLCMYVSVPSRHHAKYVCRVVYSTYLPSRERLYASMNKQKKNTSRVCNIIYADAAARHLCRRYR